MRSRFLEEEVGRERQESIQEVGNARRVWSMRVS